MNIKIEDMLKARTKSTRTDRWDQESHHIEVDNANEVEIIVYDKPDDHPLPISMMWVRLADLADELRRKKIESEFQQQGWVSADRMGNPGAPPPQFPMNPQAQHYGDGMPPGPGAPQGYGGASSAMASNAPVAVEAWFSLEPRGQILLTLGFCKLRSTFPFSSTHC